MQPTVPHVLSPADSASATAFARQIHAFAEPLNRQVISRYGMDVFQGVQPTTSLTLDATYIMYHFPGVAEYILPFIDDDARATAFENELALRVHLLTVRQPLPVLSFEVNHDSN